jgi:8-amino-3,8-dideoxy-alpha-D-manno-octulosonate transaminase
MFPGALRLDESEEQAVIEAVREVMRSKRLFRHYGLSASPLRTSRVRKFERAFAHQMGAGYALGVNSGTSALMCGLVGIGIGPGDEVIVPAYTWLSTPSSVLAVGAVPVVAEVDDSLNIDPRDVRRKISPHTKAIIAVHMRGAPARMDELMGLAQEKNLRVLEDTAQAAGGSFRGRSLGSIGDAGAYSFQMSKVMTAGEGGMVTTDDRTVHRRAEMFHDGTGCVYTDVSTEEWLPGVNLRMSELHGAILYVQLSRLERLIADMQARKSGLKHMLGGRLEEKGVRFRTIHDPVGDTSIALIFFLPDSSRIKEVVNALADENVPASRLYQEMKYLPHDYIDLHAYPGWRPILHKRTWSAHGGPWRWHPREIEYSESACPATVDRLRRAVHIDVSPDLGEQQLEQMAAAITKVISKQL